MHGEPPRKRPRKKSIRPRMLLLNGEEHVSTEELTQRYGIPRSTEHKLAAQGILRFQNVPPGRPRAPRYWSCEDAQAFIEGRRTPQVNPAEPVKHSPAEVAVKIPSVVERARVRRIRVLHAGVDQAIRPMEAQTTISPAPKLRSRWLRVWQKLRRLVGFGRRP